jgi:hypothetical protein
LNTRLQIRPMISSLAFFFRARRKDIVVALTTRLIIAEFENTAPMIRCSAFFPWEPLLSFDATRKIVQSTRIRAGFETGERVFNLSVGASRYLQHNQRVRPLLRSEAIRMVGPPSGKLNCIWCDEAGYSARGIGSFHPRRGFPFARVSFFLPVSHHTGAIQNLSLS